MLCALIMAGGKGTRFWPISTEEKPKQFLNLVGEDTMLQMTYKRINELVPNERIFICTGEKYVKYVKEQIIEIDSRNIIIESEGRNTAPCIALSSFIIKRYYKNANIIVLPADHLINNTDRFIKNIQIGNEFLSDYTNSIITLGIIPSRPECGYGYIKIRKFPKEEAKELIEVESFIEKPNKEKAQKYLESGNYLWNSGVFLWNVNSILDKIKSFIPNTYYALEKIMSCNEEDINGFVKDNYAKTDEISIDYAILEKTDEIYVIPSNIGWDDIGTWQAVERYKVKDEQGNVTVGKTSYIDGAKNMVVSSGKQIIIDGLSDIYVIESEDKIVVGLKKNLDKVKELQQKLWGK